MDVKFVGLLGLSGSLSCIGSVEKCALPICRLPCQDAHLDKGRSCNRCSRDKVWTYGPHVIKVYRNTEQGVAGLATLGYKPIQPFVQLLPIMSASGQKPDQGIRASTQFPVIDAKYLRLEWICQRHFWAAIASLPQIYPGFLFHFLLAYVYR